MSDRKCEYCDEERGDLHVCRVDHLQNRIEALWEAHHAFESRLSGYRRDSSHKAEEIERQKRMRRSEREALAEWLDRRIQQQEQAMTPRWISHDTKRIIEIEISMLKRYREIVIEGKYRVEDALMPRFTS